MNAQEIISLVVSAGADDRKSILAALEDGALLASLGITDDDQEEVELAHDEVRHASQKAIAIEDSGGGLHLALVVGARCIRWFSGFECSDSSVMQEELESAAVDGVSKWDGAEEDPQANYDDMVASEYGYEIIGQFCDSELTVYPEDMGRAGRRWSRTSYDD